MPKIFLIIFLTAVSVLSFGQVKEKAIQNFESFYSSFKNAYPADKSKDSFKNYSELDTIKRIPEQLEMMANYEPSKFYDLYLYHIKYLRDTLINIYSLDLSPDIKDTYKKFRQSIVEGEKTGKFNYKIDAAYSEKLKALLKTTQPPKTGYYQTANITTLCHDGQIKESKIIIIYNNDLEVLDFSEIE